MRKVDFLPLICVLLGVVSVNGEDPYRFYTWTVTYGTISPLGVPQQVGKSGHLRGNGDVLNVRKFSCVFSCGLCWDFEGHSHQWSVSWAST